MNLDLHEVGLIIDRALAEDIGKGDVTGKLLIPENHKAALSFINREPVVVCGVAIVPLVFAKLNKNIEVTVHVKDGERAAAGTQLIDVNGPARAILTAERVALNLFQRMCAVATMTAQYVDAVRGTDVIILDTRKTMPGLRVLDKFAVRVGGGQSHRMRLDDGILIKDNHIQICGGIKAALELAMKGNLDLPIEIECDNAEQAMEALALGAKRIMLDNMDIPSMKKVVGQMAGRAELEASGNVSLANVRQIAETGVDFISVGRLTHSVANVDIGLDTLLK